MAKTEEELDAELSRAMAAARAQYDSIVKPAQEKFKAAEQEARAKLELITKPLYEALPKHDEHEDNGKYLIQPLQDIFKSVSLIESKRDLVQVQREIMPREVSPETYEFLKQIEINTATKKIIDNADHTYRKVVDIAMSDYKKIEKSAKQQLIAAERLVRMQYDESVKELRKVDDWFEFRRTYQKSLRPGSTYKVTTATEAAPSTQRTPAIYDVQRTGKVGQP